ncbi:unnamed protein product [Arabidopsis lyrata]|nr:unnamed protein product [Arabidopsis lyrata]
MTENCISFQDLKASKLSGYVLNILFNLNKFMASQTHDPFCIHQEEVLTWVVTWLTHSNKFLLNPFSELVCVPFTFITSLQLFIIVSF